MRVVPCVEKVREFFSGGPIKCRGGSLECLLGTPGHSRITCLKSASASPSSDSLPTSPLFFLGMDFFACLRRWRDFPSLYAWLRDVYQLPGVAETIDIEGARRSYFAQLL